MLRLFPSFVAALLAVLALAAPAPAQQASPETNAAQPAPTIGAPQLRDFQLEGTRTTLPAEPVDEAPAPTERAEPAQSRSPVAEPEQAGRPAPARAREAPRSAGPAPAVTETVARPATPQVEAAPFADLFPAEDPARDAPPPPDLAQPIAQDSAAPDYTLWYAVGAGLLFLLGFAWLRSRRAAAPALARAAPAEAAEPAPRPRPAPVAPALPAVDEALRPWLEIEFKPEKLVATDQDTSVHFQLLVRNSGKSEARNVRITAKMFNPSPDQKEAINAFFATPPKAGGQPVTIPPQLAARFKPSVVMPRESIRVLEVQGRPIFVPTVAINIQYEWGDGRRGQTCKSFLIGTEKEGQPAEKMGAFRLDLGPRIYRHVGGRPLELARAV